MTTRRNFILSSMTLGASAMLRGTASASELHAMQEREAARANELREGSLSAYTSITVPSGGKVTSRVQGGVRVMHVTVSEFEHAFAPGLKARCWGYNGHVNGPLIEAVEGERVRIYVTNDIPAPTTIHWHGFLLPNGMDGVSGLTQPPIAPGETWVYEFELVQHGTHMFHSHHDTMTQEGLGLTGMFVIHPKQSDRAPVDRDFALMLHEWRIDAGASRPNPNEMSDFNVLTMNGKVFPHLEPLVMRTGQRVRIRIGNLSAMDHHPIHLHGVEFFETAIDGLSIPEDHQRKRVTVLVGVGETRDIEFVPEYEGDWAFHCHMTHHVMNQMGHAFPNMIGVETSGFDGQMRSLVPGYMTMGTTGMKDMTDTKMAIPPNSIPMQKADGQFGADISLAGMAGLLKVRTDITDEQLARNEDPGWYKHPEGSGARKATPEELRRDGVNLEKRS